MNSAQQSAVLSGHIETSDTAGALDSSSVINTEENKEKMASANIPEKTDRKFLEGIKTQLQRCFITAANNSIGNWASKSLYVLQLGLNPKFWGNWKPAKFPGDPRTKFVFVAQ